VAGLAAGLWMLAAFGFGSVGLAVGVVVGLGIGLVYPQSWLTSLAFAQLALA
jgi:hypothetical protein